jgi:CheY-like chemotaxis protein
MKSNLLAHVSHELRTPLQGILGYAELLAGKALDNEQRGWLLAQRRQGDLLLRLVNDLIDLGALQNGVLTLAAHPGQLAALVEDSVLSLRPRAHLRQLYLELEQDPALPGWIEFDADRMRQIVLNLVGNALKFTERGGVVVCVRLCPPDAPYAPLDEALVEIAVADTGPGIAPADQARLFKAFTRIEATRHVEGAGMGLAVARGLCVAMGGSLEVESDGQTGSTFRARLKLKIAAVPSAPGGESAPPAAPHSGLRIVVADDNTLVRELYVAHLTAQGAVCVGASDGFAALAAVAAEPRPDLLLLDLAMPRLDGLEVARRLRQDGPAGLCIIGISAHGNRDYRERALAAGMDEFLVKPVGLADLSRCLLRCVRRPAAALALAAGGALPAELKRQLKAIFQRETPPLLDELGVALARADWPTIEARAHYLKNSAWVLGEAELADQCELVCDAARQEAGSGLGLHLDRIRRLVATL